MKYWSDRRAKKHLQITDLACSNLNYLTKIKYEMNDNKNKRRYEQTGQTTMHRKLDLYLLLKENKDDDDVAEVSPYPRALVLIERKKKKKKRVFLSSHYTKINPIILQRQHSLTCDIFQRGGIYTKLKLTRTFYCRPTSL